ncbi:MAG: hypothetical protein HYX94_09080 [Chloroflexi bacterium]|nr:hypothetical protein [Chloroflexota bacterium]
MARETFTATAKLARQRAAAHNREGLCGLPSCGTRLPGAICRVCGSEYCPSHLNARLFRVPASPADKSADGKRAPKKERFFICDQCVDLVDRYGIVELSPPPEATSNDS